MVSFFLSQHGLLKADVFCFVSAGNSSTAGGRTEEGEGATHRGESVYQLLRFSSVCLSFHLFISTSHSILNTSLREVFAV